MSIEAVRLLSDIGMADVNTVGGKAGSLGELLRAGIKVPAGAVLTIESAALTPDTRSVLLTTILRDLGDGPFAVRSSGISEDGAERSFAGMYESVLDVSAADVSAAVDRVLDSAHAARLGDYERGGTGRLAVIVQRMIRPAAAGVALTADPINGDRHSCIVTAVRGTGERLVSGSAHGDEWVVRHGLAVVRREPERAINRGQALQVAREAERIAKGRGAPQDIEWAIDETDVLWILQARPMTALPAEVSWESPAPGAYTRDLRFAEWIPEPVTPLFETWLLTSMENRLHDRLRQLIGQHAPRPYHVVVNGWYFYSINFLSGGALLRSLPDILWHLIRTPRYVAGVMPATVRHSIPVLERAWRDLLPRYQAAVVAADGRVESVAVTELPALIDGLADFAGEYFASIAAFAGTAYKMEMNLARFFRQHIQPTTGGSHLPLLAGFETPADPGPHAVASLDWAQHPPSIVRTTPGLDPARERLVSARQAAEAAAYEVLATSPRRLTAFRRLLAETQRLVPIREEHVREFTLAWPVMRRAVQRLGETLVADGLINNADDIFFLTRTEALEALRTRHLDPAVDVAARRARRTEQARLVPPAFVGRMNRAIESPLSRYPQSVGAVRSETALVSGTPASPGRVTAVVRVIRGPADFDLLQPGEILVAPLTAPAWTPLFGRAAGVVTDVGSAAAHASIIAREYGIPAIVGCGDATARLRTGQRVTMDGGTGNVEPA